MNAVEIQKIITKYKKPLFCLFLIFSSSLVYSLTVNHGFVNCDDPSQLTNNKHVLSVLTWKNLMWSFSSESPCSPLTFIAYNLCHTIFGLKPGVYHVMSLILHIANSLLLFFVLNRMTGEFWKSAFVGTLFALHPMNVESVAWVAELNNVLSGLFFMLTLLTYKIYTEQTTWKRYVLALLVFELGLLAKPVLMTLPFILFLLDLWPLKRIKVESREESEKAWGFRTLGVPIPRLILEKIPFMVLSLLSLASNLVGANKRMGLYSPEIVPMSLRISNAIVSTLKYLGKLFWPHGLALNYPYPSMIPWWQVIGAGLVLILITILVLRAIFRSPYYLMGWLWFLGGLVPFLGIFQAGLWPEMADRYAYLTYIGIFMALTWGIPDLIVKWRCYRPIIITVGSGVILILMVLTWNQVGFWKNSETLFSHAIEVTKNNFAAYNNLGLALFDRGDIDGAIQNYRESMRIKPSYSKVYINLGVAFAEHKDTKSALVYYTKAIQIDPNNADAHTSLGSLLEGIGRTDEALMHFNEAIRINPNSSEAHNNLGNLLLHKGNYDEAVRQYSEALQINPHQAEVYNNLGTAFILKGNMKKAIEFYQKSLQEKSDYLDAIENLKNARINQKSLEDLLMKIQQSTKTDPVNPTLYTKLGDVYRQLGEYDESIGQYQKAIAIQPNYVQAMYGLVLIYSNRQEYVKALDVLQKIRQLQPGNPEVYYNIACIYAKQSIPDEAIAWLKQSIEKGFHSWDLIKKDPDLDNIRNTAFINELIKNH